MHVIKRLIDELNDVYNKESLDKTTRFRETNLAIINLKRALDEYYYTRIDVDFSTNSKELSGA